MNFKDFNIDDYIDFDTLFMTICILIFYEYIMNNSNIIIETKGQFNSADRKKMKLIKLQNPKLDIRFIFSNSKSKIGKKSKTTYGKWCEMFGFKYHCVQSTKKEIPDEWLKEIKEIQNGKTRN